MSLPTANLSNPLKSSNPVVGVTHQERKNDETSPRLESELERLEDFAFVGHKPVPSHRRRDVRV